MYSCYSLKLKVTSAKKVEIMQITAALWSPSPLPPLLCNFPKHCLMAHEWCTFLLCCAHVFQAGVQTSDSCRKEAKKGGGLSATKRAWILEIQYYKNKHSTTSCNRSSLSGSGKQDLVTAQPIFVSLLCPCAAGLPWSNNSLSPSPPFWVFTVEGWCVATTSAGFFLSPSKATKQSYL